MKVIEKIGPLFFTKKKTTRTMRLRSSEFGFCFMGCVLNVETQEVDALFCIHRQDACKSFFMSAKFLMDKTIGNPGGH